MTIINLTPHPIHIYSPHTPDQATAEELSAGLIASIPPSGRMARLRTTDLGHEAGITVGGHTIPVHRAAYGDVDDLPAPTPGVWYVAPLLTALAVTGRRDLLVPHQQVRNTEGTTVGCRALGRVTRDAAPTAGYDYEHKDPRGVLRGDRWEDLIDGRPVAVEPTGIAEPFGMVAVRVGGEVAVLHREVVREMHQALGYARRRAGEQQCLHCPEMGEPAHPGGVSRLYRCVNGHVFDVEDALARVKPCKQCHGYGNQ